MKPRVGISRCLLGDDVRYDGTNRRSSAVAMLSANVEWVPVCPEVEVGMGVPREPIQLVACADGGVASAANHVQLLGVQSRENWTDRMDQWSRMRAGQLAALGLSGFVLKARSPSCGPEAVLVHHDAAEPAPTGRGLFAEALAAGIPGLPLIDEEMLESRAARDGFLAQVRAWHLSHQ